MITLQLKVETRMNPNQAAILFVEVAKIGNAIKAQAYLKTLGLVAGLSVSNGESN